jgi:hypothetical protein
LKKGLYNNADITTNKIKHAITNNDIPHHEDRRNSNTTFIIKNNSL